MSNIENGFSPNERRPRALNITVDQFMNGDPETWGGAFRVMCRWATPMVGPFDAEDVAQETWIRVTAAFSRMAPERRSEIGINFGSYLRKAVKNSSGMYVREMQRRKARQIKSHASDPANIGKNSDSLVDNRLEGRWNEEVLRASLPRSSQADILILLANEDLTYEEAFERLGVSFTTGRGILNRARANARKLDIFSDE